MEKELDPAVIKATQSSLGKYIKRPPLTDKLLKKPPFRFLHDIVTTVLKNTGFFEGLFEEEELVSENVKDRENKIVFLNKVITVLCLTTGKALAVKPSKIVAGQEPDKTNEFLQSLAEALDNKLSSADAVKRYKEGVKLPQPTNEAKSKEPIKSVKKSNEVKKLTSKSNEKLTSKKKDSREKSLPRNDKDKAAINKSKQKENDTIKKESPPKKTSQPTKTITKTKSVEKVPENQNENIKQRNNKPASPIVNNDDKLDSKDDSFVDNVSNKKKDTTTNIQIIPNTEQDAQGKLNTSYTIHDNDLNSSLSSQDLMEVDNDNDGNHLSEKYIDGSMEVKSNEHLRNKDVIINTKDSEEIETEENKFNSNIRAVGNGSGPESLIKEIDKSNDSKKLTKDENKSNNLRPPSVRPSSSRPGAPRLREKHDNVITGTDNILIGKVNIIVESTPNEEEEDTSIIILEQQTEPLSISQENQDHLQISSNQHGHLVQQILDSQKEFSQSAGKTEIEWQFGAQKAREASHQEIEQLRFNIQALSRVANPLGKLLDHIQEDVEVMRQELQQWTKNYEEASKELLKQKTANEDSLFPLRTKLKQLDVDIEEKRDKINDLKIVIHKNSSRVEKLLASGNNVQ